MNSQKIIDHLQHRTILIEDIQIIAAAVVPYQNAIKQSHDLIKHLCKIFVVMDLLTIPKNNKMTQALESMHTDDLEYLHDTLDRLYAKKKVAIS